MYNFYYEIKKITTQAKESSYSSEIENIKSKISLSAMKGYTDCTIMGNISYEAVNYLTEQGFNIKHFQEYGQRFGYTISWN